MCATIPRTPDFRYRKSMRDRCVWGGVHRQTDRRDGAFSFFVWRSDQARQRTQTVLRGHRRIELESE